MVYTSLVGCDGPPDLLNAAHRETEVVLRSTGVPWTALRNNLYLEGLADLQAAAAATGRHVSNAGDGAVSYVDRDRCAEVAASVLLQSAQGVVEVHGPRPLDTVAVASLFSERLGRPIEAVVLDDQQYREHLRSVGVTPRLAAALVALGQAMRAGVYAGA